MAFKAFDGFNTGKRGCLVTREVAHEEVKPGDYILVSFGLCKVIGKRTREDGYIVYSLDRQGDYGLHPSNWPDLAIPA